METSDPEEAKEEAEEKGFPLFRLWRYEKLEWRPYENQEKAT